VDSSIFTISPAIPAAPVIQSGVGGDSHVVLNWSSVQEAAGYNIYQSVTSDLYGSPIFTTGNSELSYDVTGLTNGTTYYFVVKATNAAGDSAASNVVNAVPTAPSSGVNPTQPVAPQAGGTGVEVFVNGKSENAGSATTTKVGDQTVTTVVVDQQKLASKLESEGANAVVTIPFNTNADVIVGQLNGQMVKNMEQKQAMVDLRTEKASYTLPADQINIDAISDQIGKKVELKDIKVHIEIAKTSESTAKTIESSAKRGEYTIVAPPVDFRVTCTNENKTVEVSRFSAYVERTIAIPEGVDPSKITTGVVLNNDGTFTHVPTVIIINNGKYYAKINSLTNSTYSVIWYTKKFKDVEGHWAKKFVNEMGSRLVIKGIDQNNFAPDRNITRAEFAAIVGRALGLRESGTVNKFSDVKGSDWFSGAVGIAYEYGIISGYEDGTFRPDAAISREEAMAMIARAMAIAGMDINISESDTGEQLARFIDKDGVAGWAKKSAAACVKYGITVGNNSLLTPKDNITRAETATIIIRTLQKANLI